MEDVGGVCGHWNIIEYGTIIMVVNLMVFVGDHAILASSDLSFSIRERREQSKNYEPAKIWSPPRIDWSV